MLAMIVAAIGTAFAVLGVAVMFAPGSSRRLMRWMQTPRALYVAVGARIAIGAFFVLASDAVAWPYAIGTAGIVILAAGLAGLFIGIVRLRALMAWLIALPDAAFRGAAVFAIAFGAFIVYAAIWALPRA